MTQKRVRRRSQSTTESNRYSLNARYTSDKSVRDRRTHSWNELRTQDGTTANHALTSLIEQDAPLRTNTTLVLMYGPFQAEMGSGNNQGVASWIRDCVRKHGLPSLVRFDYRQRSQVFRRDQFQPWLEPIIDRSA